MGDLGGGKGGSGRKGTGVKEVRLTPLEIYCMRPMMEGTERGRCFRMRWQSCKETTVNSLAKGRFCREPSGCVKKCCLCRERGLMVGAIRLMQL